MPEEKTLSHGTPTVTKRQRIARFIRWPSFRRWWHALLADTEDPEKDEPPTGGEGSPSEDEGERAAQIPRPVIDIPETVLEEYRANEKAHSRENRISRNIAIAAVIGAWGYATIALFQYAAMLKSNQQAVEALRVTQRAYVNLGSAHGKLAEFGPPGLEADKPIIILYFMNAGQSTARHVVVHVDSSAQQEFTAIQHRHRFKGPQSSLTGYQGRSIIEGGEWDLAAHGEHQEYIMTPGALWTRDALANPQGSFVVYVEFEYCDIFGGYHCQRVATKYSTLVNDFIPFGMAGPCYIESGSPPPEEHEIEPCEQPDEPEFHISGTPRPPPQPPPATLQRP